MNSGSNVRSEVAIMVSLLLAFAVVVPVYFKCLPTGSWYGTQMHTVVHVVYTACVIGMIWLSFFKTKSRGVGDAAGSIICVVLGPFAVFTVLFYGLYMRFIER